MARRTLHVVDGGYRATLEEQDDTVVWFCHALRGAGAELDLLLSGNAVGYGVRFQEVAPLAFGSRRQKHAPDLAGDLASLMGKRVACFYVEEDAAERGIPPGELAGLLTRYDQVHRW